MPRHGRHRHKHSRPSRSTRSRSLLAGLTVVIIGVGLGSVASNHRAPAESVRGSGSSAAEPKSTSFVYRAPVLTGPVGLVVALVATTPAFAWPGGPAAPSVAATWHGSPLFLPVIATLAGDLEIRLPTRPNGSTTWIRASNLRLYHSPYRIVIDLASRHLLLYRNDKLVLDAPAGVGTTTDPTPTGHFFVASFATAPTPAYGPFVIVTSAHSDAITDWEESGDAVVAIHGPLGEDAEIGTTGARISHGCIRLHDNDLELLRAVPDGSPIDVIG